MSKSLCLVDGLAEQDWDGWDVQFRRLGDRVELVGDDIFVTDPAIIRHGIDRGFANSLLIKLNQIGTDETIEAVEPARSAGWTAVVSHRYVKPPTRSKPTWSSHLARPNQNGLRIAASGGEIQPLARNQARAWWCG
jgi:hypothetical protein